MLLCRSPGVADDFVEALCAECRANLLGRGVDTLHTAVALAAQSLLYKVKFGMHQRHLATEERWTTENKILAPNLNALLYPLDALKPNQLCRARGIGNICREALLATRAGIAYTRDAGTQLHQRRVHILVQLAYGVYLCAVDVAERVVAQKVADGENTKLLLQQFCPRLAHASDIFHIIIEPRCHNTKIEIIS